MFSCALWWFNNNNNCYYCHAENQIFTLNSTVVSQIFTHIGAEALQTQKPLASLTVSKRTHLCIMIHFCLLFCDSTNLSVSHKSVMLPHPFHVVSHGGRFVCSHWSENNWFHILNIFIYCIQGGTGGWREHLCQQQTVSHSYCSLTSCSHSLVVFTTSGFNKK